MQVSFKEKSHSEVSREVSFYTCCLRYIVEIGYIFSRDIGNEVFLAQKLPPQL